MSDVYYDEKEFGLEKVEELNEDDLSYEFNILCVWRHKDTGNLYYAQDSGCSCPSPFEDYRDIGSLEHITKDSYDSFVKSVNNFPAEMSERVKLVDKVWELLKSEAPDAKA